MRPAETAALLDGRQAADDDRDVEVGADGSRAVEASAVETTPA